MMLNQMLSDSWYLTSTVQMGALSVPLIRDVNGQYCPLSGSLWYSPCFVLCEMDLSEPCCAGGKASDRCGCCMPS